MRYNPNGMGAEMQGLEIQYRLRRKGFTQADLARDLGVSHGIVSRVIRGKDRSERIENEIVRILGRNPFPEPKFRRSANA